MELDWIEAVGYAGTGFTILAYGAKHLIPLRIAAILSSLAFLAYGLLSHSYPLVLMEVVLLPINIFRLYELIAPQRRLPAATVARVRA
jgi:CRP/FNR family transcriptional regulator, cyclic AMP receptor protein